MENHSMSPSCFNPVQNSTLPTVAQQSLDAVAVLWTLASVCFGEICATLLFLLALQASLDPPRLIL